MIDLNGYDDDDCWRVDCVVVVVVDDMLVEIDGVFVDCYLVYG